MKTPASELTQKKIRVNAVSPGPIGTNYFDRSNLSKEQIEGMAAYVMPQVPLKRFGQAEEVAAAVTFLASADASFVHGAELSVDGGFSRIK